MSQTDLQILIRKAADDELSPEESRLLEACMEDSASPFDVEQAIAFERSLRSAVSRCMSEDGGVCPIDLPNQVRQAMEHEHQHAAETGDSKSVLAVLHHWLPSGLAAGIVVLIAAALAIGLWGRGWGITDIWRNDRVEFVPRYSWTVTTQAGAVRELRDMTGLDEVDIPDLSEFGCVFDGANRLSLDDGRTVLQLGYSGSGPYVMIWIQSASDLADDFYGQPMSEGQAFRIKNSADVTNRTQGDPMADNLAWVSGDLVFYVSADTGSGPATSAERTVAQALGMPAQDIVSISRSDDSGNGQ
ncbi:MAG: hypothetical protein D8M59_08305 [Planctomycetes bacterium]|nr:hypothetical protein [Planctomycetota bacterium]NOG54004.1 hypothetical protein [Planctomycetota bacterium]